MAETSKRIQMKAVVFAGGVGTRMWPLSRVESPKQFEKMVDSKSTLQLTIDRLRPEFDWEDIYISTGIKYISLVKKQLPKIPTKNIVIPCIFNFFKCFRGARVAIIAKKSPDQPMAIIWSDHLMKKVSLFRNVLQAGGEYISQNQDKILFIGQKARFANQNLGWIQTGKKVSDFDGFKVYKFKTFHYRPNIQLARQFFHRKDYVWNPGYFIATPKFILERYKRFMPGMYQKLLKLQSSFNTSSYQKVLKKIYPTFERISFDDAILEKLEPNKAVVLSVDFGWSDIGNWQALKEALQKSKKGNVVKGKVFPWECEDSLIYNYTNQLVTTIDLNDIVVVNTDDVLLVCTKESMKNIKKVVGHFKTKEKYKKFT